MAKIILAQHRGMMAKTWRGKAFLSEINLSLMRFEQYETSVDEVCTYQKVVQHDHYFAAEALKAGLLERTNQNGTNHMRHFVPFRSRQDVRYHLSRIENKELREQVEYLLDQFFVADGVDSKFLEKAMDYHGWRFLLHGSGDFEDVMDELEEEESGAYPDTHAPAPPHMYV